MPAPPRAQAGRDLEQERRLADAGLAADQHERTRHEAAAEHAVELADARRAGAAGRHRRRRRARRARRRRAGVAPPAGRGRAGSRTSVSTRLFQTPQLRHWPSQRRKASPQLWQTYRDWRLRHAFPGSSVVGGRRSAVARAARRRPARAPLRAWIDRPASGSLSTTIVWPGSYAFSSSCSASGSSIMFWITRRSGRAP